jgi:putative serine protease PepD
MSNIPEDEQTPARSGADEVARTSDEPTQQIPADQPTDAGRPTQAGEPVDAGGPTQAAEPVDAGQPTRQWPAQQPAFGWGNPGPSQPATQTPGEPTTAHSDPFAGVGSYPPAADAGPEAAATRRRPPRLWVSVLGAAAAAALIASFATAGLTGAFDDNGGSATPSSLATIGRSGTNTAPVAGSSTDNNPDWEKVAAAVSASVVAIQVKTASGGAEGSGVIIDAAGNVLTNNHVVAGAQNDTVQVTLGDGRLYKAKIVGTDPTTDLAVVRIAAPPSDLKPATFGDSGAAVVGEPVMAVGNPLGLANTVTTGIVSAVDRPVSASAETSSDTVVTNAIQIDAAINPGNSGGPLFDSRGRVIGITSSIATLSGGGGSSQSGSIGLGFAIPINLAQNIAGQLVKSGTAEHAFLGVSLTDGNATADGTTRLGAVVEQVTAGSPAAKGGVQKGDIVVAIDGQPVAGAESLTAYVRERTAGAAAKLTVVRGAKVLDVTVTLAAKATTVAPKSSSTPPANQGQNGSGQGDQNPFGQFFGGQG